MIDDLNELIASVERIIVDARYAVRDGDTRQTTASGERIFVNLIILSVIICGQRQGRIASYVAEQIIDVVIRVEQISVLVDDLARSVMDFFCIISNVTVIG